MTFADAHASEPFEYDAHQDALIRETGQVVNDLKQNVEQFSIDEISDVLGKFGFHDKERRMRDDAHVGGFG